MVEADRTLGDTTPTGTGLKPDGTQLQDMEGDKLSRRARFRKELYREADRTGYSALIAGTFFEAADQRFAAGHDRAAITGFVATARASSPSVADNSTRCSPSA